jgi:hypothetical protein
MSISHLELGVSSQTPSGQVRNQPGGFGYQRSATDREDVLMDDAKGYRVNAEKLQKAVAGESVVETKTTDTEKRRR